MVVVILFTPGVLQTATNNFDTNCRPFLVSNFDGIPKLSVQCSEKMREAFVAFARDDNMALDSLVFQGVTT